MPKQGGAAKTTTNHDVIRRWVEKRGGCPAMVKRTGSANDPGILRIDYPGYSGVKSLKKISWDDFFDKFEKNNLAFLYQEQTATGRPSRFSKLVARTGSSGGRTARSKARTSAATGTRQTKRRSASGAATKRTASTTKKRTTGSRKASSASAARKTSAPARRGSSTRRATTGSSTRRKTSGATGRSRSGSTRGRTSSRRTSG